MLQRDIDVGANLVVRCNRLQQTTSDFVGISVQEPNPAEIFDGSEFFEQQSQAIFETEILSIASGVLANEGDFTHARAGETFRLGDYGFKSARAKFATQLWNNAKRAGMIASLRNLDIGSVARRGQNSGCRVIVQIIGEIGDGAVPGFAGKTALRLASISLRTRRQDFERGIL